MKKLTRTDAKLKVLYGLFVGSILGIFATISAINISGNADIHDISFSLNLLNPSNEMFIPAALFLIGGVSIVYSALLSLFLFFIKN